MRNFKNLMGALALLFASAASPVFAEDVTVAAGKRSQIGSFALYSDVECAATAIPEAKIARQPSNGRVDIVLETRIVSGSGCKPFQMKAQIVYYTPKSGFRGSDEVAVDFFFNRFIDAPRPTSHRFSYSVTVK